MATTLMADGVLTNGKIINDLPVTIDNGHIIALDAWPGAEEKKLDGLLAPGFIDVQVNGGGGCLLNDDPSPSTIETIVKTHARYGTTGLLPTLISDELSVMQKAADAVSAALSKEMPGVLGIHFEGPHLSKQRKGVHPESRLRPISDAELELYRRDDLGVKVVTVAPEVVSPETIKDLVDAGVHVCLGHSNADYETTTRAINAGATGFTHIFNAMSRLQAREPGMVGAALEDQSTWCGLILDSHHVHPAVARIAHKIKQPGKIMLVSDAMSLIGTEEERCKFFETEILRSGDRLNVPSGELAGSMLDMATAVRNAVQLLDVPLKEALSMASTYPANFLGIEELRGSIEVGHCADLVLLDEQLTVQAAWIGGQLQ